MATLDWSPSLFEGQSWTAWEDKVKLSQGEDVPDGPEKEKKESNIMKLRQNDKSLFGICPSRDECYLVICEKCGQIIKPQALKCHIEQRHSGSLDSSKKVVAAVDNKNSRTMNSKPVISITKTTLASVTNPTVSVPKTAATATVSKTCNAQELLSSAKFIAAASSAEALKRKAPSPKPNCSGADSRRQATAKLSRLKAQQSQPVLNLEKVRVPSPKTPPVAADPRVPSPKMPSGGSTPQGKEQHAGVGVNGLDAHAKSLQKVPKQIPCKDREFSPDIHCGVKVSDTGEQCTRSLTCKRHLLSKRRAVCGRSKPFDQLLNEHREKKEFQKQLKLQQAAVTAARQLGQSQGFTPLNRVVQMAATSPVNSGGVVAVTSPSTMKPVNRAIHSPYYRANSRELPNQSPTAHQSDTWSRVDEPFIPDFTPAPAAVCTFGARYKCRSLMFNRKMDLLSSAFRDCAERFLHPPPFKKMCVEGKRTEPKMSSQTEQSDYSQEGSTAQSKTLFSSKNKSAMRAIKPKDAMSKSNSSPVASASFNHSFHNKPRKKNSSGSSSGNPTSVPANHVVAAATSQATVPVAIPLQGALLQNKNCRRDYNLVVTGALDPNSAQLININTSDFANSLNFVQLPIFATVDGLSGSLNAGNGAGKVSLAAMQQSTSSTNQVFRSGSVSPQVSAASLTNGIMSSGRNHSLGSRTPSPATDLSNSGQFTILAGKPKPTQSVGKAQFPATLLNTGRLLTASGYPQVGPLMQQIQIQGSSIKVDGSGAPVGSVVGTATGVRQLPRSIPMVKQEGSKEMSARAFFSSNDDALKQQQESSATNAVS